MTRFSFRRAARAHAVVGDIAAQAGKLGIEICDVSGHVEEVAARVQRQAKSAGRCANPPRNARGQSPDCRGRARNEQRIGSKPRPACSSRSKRSKHRSPTFTDWSKA